ncbi:DUF1194 domain-containing protein [Alphaproteobacteria bacterium GH1-50]|uniref:DUF1194 domain-containing protein n=1 Tax=Kangsaoukella pontilimi TaxID=2691042 RepID=A0A7C9MZS8_9RHOB|nr:DUF1194 domain-containing protein [Kangsaoukella pontilimi]MXQ07718.1 DUF1194 domain-containing protein [Kangsaoukella pontilimi]
MRIFVIPLLAFLALPAAADPVEVDVELALMVDVSRSMGPMELELQRKGYAEAIASDEVTRVIETSFTGRIALTYVEWAGDGLQRVVVPWTIVDGPEAAQAIADQLTATYDYGMRRTSVSGAIRFATYEIENNDFIGLRRVIDVSGDGPNNDGRPVTMARDAALEAGIVINGLPLMTEDSTSRWGIDDLDVYYERCVIGGPGAFVVPVTDWADFPLAVRRKLVLELVGPMPEGLWPVQGRTGATETGYDCMIGEKLRRERELIYGEP